MGYTGNGITTKEQSKRWRVLGVGEHVKDRDKYCESGIREKKVTESETEGVRGKRQCEGQRQIL